jgi:phytoene synthase
MVTTERLAALSDAYKECQRLARRHPENFPVASWLLPRHLRPHVAAIYTFARTADDFADEPGREAAERLQLLDEWGGRLRATDVTLDSSRLPEAARGPAATSLFAALAHTRREFALPIDPFEDLLSAFRQDVTKTRYDTWQEVFDYCRRSANPVGRLVLRLFGYNSPELDRYSDAVCTALQLTNFWQDFAIDWTRGRLYLPAEEWETAGASPSDLDARKVTPEWQAALAHAAARTRELFHQGRPIPDHVHGRLRYELRATWLGGMRILERVERVNFDVFNHRPRLRLRDGMVIAWRAARWRA